MSPKERRPLLATPALHSKAVEQSKRLTNLERQPIRVVNHVTDVLTGRVSNPRPGLIPTNPTPTSSLGIVYVGGAQGKIYRFTQEGIQLPTFETGFTDLTVNGLGISPLNGKLYACLGQTVNGITWPEWGVVVVNLASGVVEAFYNTGVLGIPGLVGVGDPEQSGYPTDLLFQSDGTWWMQDNSVPYSPVIELGADGHFYMAFSEGFFVERHIYRDVAEGEGDPPAAYPFFNGGRWSASGASITNVWVPPYELGALFGWATTPDFWEVSAAVGVNLGDVRLLPPGDSSGGAVVTAFFDGQVARVNAAGTVVWQVAIDGASRVALGNRAVWLFASQALYVGEDPPWNTRLYRLNLDTGAIELGPIELPPIILDTNLGQVYRGAIYVQGSYHAGETY